MGSERVELFGGISSHYADVVAQLPRDHLVFPWIADFRRLSLCRGHS